MTNRQKIESFAESHGLKIKELKYRPCRSSFIYGDSAPSGEWSLLLENGEYYKSCIDCDSVSDGVDVMLKNVLIDIEDGIIPNPSVAQAET